MPTKIEIKPNDQSWVGKKIRCESWKRPLNNHPYGLEYLVPKFIGKEIGVATLVFKNGKKTEKEFTLNNPDGWELYEEEKQEPQFEPGEVLVSPDGEEWFVSFDGFIQPAKKLNLKPVEINKTYTKEQITKAFNRVLEEIKND